VPLDSSRRRPARLLQAASFPRASGTASVYSTRTGLSLLASFVLAWRCMSTVAAIRRDTKTWRWPAFVLADCHCQAAAYVAALAVDQGSGLLGIR
jgi:ferrous iron transport protein B